MTVKYFGYARTKEGLGLPGKSVYVYLSSDGTLAALENEAGDTIDNPVSTREDGYYEFYLDPETYDLVVNGQKISNVGIGIGEKGDKGDAGTDGNPVTAVALASVPDATANQGRIIFVTDGCKVGETTGNGTGVMAYSDGLAWLVFSTDEEVAN